MIAFSETPGSALDARDGIDEETAISEDARRRKGFSIERDILGMKMPCSFASIGGGEVSLRVALGRKWSR